MAFGAGFRPAQQIAFGNDADNLAFTVDYGQAADPMLEHQLCRLNDRRLRANAHGFPCHDIGRFHSILLSVTRFRRQRRWRAPRALRALLPKGLKPVGPPPLRAAIGGIPETLYRRSARRRAVPCKPERMAKAHVSMLGANERNEKLHWIYR